MIRLNEHYSVVFEEGGGFNRPEVEKPCSLKSTKSFDFVLMSYLPHEFPLTF